MSTFHIIAEAGTNHNASPDLGRRLIEIASESGADSVKFQIIYPEGLYVPGFYDNGVYRPNPSIAIRRAGMLSDDAYAQLWAFAAGLKLPITASVFDERGVRLLDRLGVPFIKLASCDLNNDPLIRLAAETGRRLVLATGMSTLAEVEHAVEVVASTGAPSPVLLHCVSIYPTPVDRANVTFVETLRREFGCEVGFSDHTESDTAAILAAALGATWFEKHFTTDRSLEGYDHPYAMEPPALKQYVQSLRDAEAALQIPEKKLSEAERSVAKGARRGLHANRDLRPGEVLAVDDVLLVRPSGPLGPGDLSRVVGRALATAVPRHTPLELTHFADPQ